MIPDFTNEGHLPQGIYTATENEFLKRFGTGSARRKWLAERLHDLFDLIKSTGKIEYVFVWGSFVSSKESPNDTDLLLIMSADFELKNVVESTQVIFRYSEARVRFNADIFWAKSSIGVETLKIWLDTYQTTKDFKRQGIVEVKLS
jgi:hypothetical protein